MPTHRQTHDSSGRVALDYARRVFRRQHEPMPPLGFEVDWADRPSQHKVYPDTVTVPLPEPFHSTPSVGIHEALLTATAPPAAARMPDLAALASVLGCGGVIDRRTEPNWNDGSGGRVRADQSLWARPTASGGGLYPAEGYLVVGRSGPLPPGVYHYGTAHHGLDRLSAGDRCADVAAATGVRAELYAVATVRFWKNAFKYGSFAYHVVTQDVGALLASWRLVLAAHGVPVEPVLWFDEPAIDGVLAVDGHEEASFAVVPIGPLTAPPPDAPDPAGRVRVVTPHRVWERSRRTVSFELVSRVHAAALVGDRPRPGPESARAGSAFVSYGDGEIISLPEPGCRPADLDVTGSLRNRRTSFGLLTARPPLDVRDLGWVLSSVARAGATGTDLAPAPRGDAWTRQWVMANSVTGLRQRVYGYDAATEALVAGAALDVTRLQGLYALNNYSLPEVAAIIVITGRLEALVAAYGARGYRMLGIEAGQAAQTAYLAATARGLGVGAVLGLDNLGVDGLLGIDGTGEHSMICVLLGHERTPRLRYDHALYRTGNGAGASREGNVR